MKVKDLKTILDGLNESDDEREILMSSDAEGNSIHDIHQLSSESPLGMGPIIIWPMHDAREV